MTSTKPVLVIELSPEAAEQTQSGYEVYMDAYRLIKDDPVWVMRHPDFSIVQKSETRGEFSNEIFLINASHQIDIAFRAVRSHLVAVFVIKGRVKLKCSKKKWKTLNKNRSLLGMAPSGSFQARIKAGSHIFYCCYLKPQKIKSLGTRYPYFREMAAALPKKGTVTLSTSIFKGQFFRLAFNKFRYKPEAHQPNFSEDLKLWELINQVLRNSTNTASQTEAGSVQTVHQVKTLLDDFGEKGLAIPPISEISERFCMHRQHLSRVYKEVFGTSPRSYISIKKMEMGYRLLSEDGLPVQVVAFRLGYTDAYSFGRQFRTHFGISPGKIRKKKRSHL